MTIDKATQLLAAVGVILMFFILGGCHGGGYKSLTIAPEIRVSIDAQDGSTVVSDAGTDSGSDLLEEVEIKDIMVERDIKPVIDGVIDVLDIERKMRTALAKEARKAAKDGLDADIIKSQAPPASAVGSVTDLVEPEPSVEPSVEPSDEPSTNEMRISHYNTDSWHGCGTSIILCKGDSAESVSIGDNALRLHGSLDKGREVWTNGNCSTGGQVNMLGLATVRFTDGEVIRFDVNKAGGITHGSC